MKENFKTELLCQVGEARQPACPLPHPLRDDRSSPPSPPQNPEPCGGDPDRELLLQSPETAAF